MGVEGGGVGGGGGGGAREKSLGGESHRYPFWHCRLR